MKCITCSPHKFPHVKYNEVLMKTMREYAEQTLDFTLPDSPPENWDNWYSGELIVTLLNVLLNC